MNRPAHSAFFAFAIASCCALEAAPPQLIEADLCIYGGTSGGVVAAVQASRMGKTSVIVEPGGHLGGMTASGLSLVDIGNQRTVGGIARDYFTRLAAAYGKELLWDVQPSATNSGRFVVEPHTAERLFDTMAREANVPVHRHAQLVSVKKRGARIVSLATADGKTFCAKMFLDATYEGDLMAQAGISYTLMREGNAKYNETYNGILYQDRWMPKSEYGPPGANGRVPRGNGAWDRDMPIDPYVVPGDPSSGLISLVDEGAPGRPGEPAPGVQAYCYRLCLTNDPANRIPIVPPSNYDPKTYEIVARQIEAWKSIGDDIDLRWFSKHDPLPNKKWDFNTATYGGNLPGASWVWPEASHAERERIAQQHEDYHRGLLYFLMTDPRVPENVRKKMRQFGLCKDEFVDNGGWPHQLYVREGRRMVADLVLTEHHVYGRQKAANSVGVGSYGTDIHEIRRIVKDGIVTREGKLGGKTVPYSIGLAAIVPRQTECENLSVTFAISASHVAFGSTRMEPVLMILSQSAATAMCQAIDEGTPVQTVNYNKLRERLLEDGQKLDYATVQ